MTDMKARRRGGTGEDLDARYGITEEEKRAAEAELDRLEREGQVWWGRLDETEEGRRLWANPKFRAAIERARQGPYIPLEEANRQAGITEEEGAPAAVERLAAEDAESGDGY